MIWEISSGRRQVLYALAAVAALQAELAVGDRLTPARGIAAVLVGAPLAFRLRFPVLVVAAVASGIAVEAALGVPIPDQLVSIVSLLVALHAVAVYTSGYRLALGAVAGLAGMAVASALGAESVIAAPAVVGIGLLVGRALGVLRFETDAMAQRNVELERERDELARVAVAEERRRIARELHDVIGHSISVMGVQAGAVRSVLRDDQVRERQALLAVERTGRQAVDEMRRLIGLLRTDEDDRSGPPPSLRRIDDLVTRMRDAGLDVQLSVEGDLTALAPGVDLVAFRIVQEALTNVLKHAPRAHVVARISTAEQTLQVQVLDDGGGSIQSSNGHRIGHGLLGMRERVALYGGELVAGSQAGGGFSVRARLPLGPA